MKRALTTLSAVLTLLLATLSAGPLQAQFPDLEKIVKVEVLPGWREADGTHIAGLRIRLAPGWKTYWRVPGEGGIPPHFNLAGSKNIRVFTPHMPRPTVYNDQGMLSIGYSDEVVFPLQMATDSPQDPIQLRGVMKIGVCEAVCIPADVPLNAILPAPGQPSAMVRAALSELPQKLRTQPECQIEPTQGALRLSLRMALPERSGEYPVIETANPGTWVAMSKTWREGGHLFAVADLYPPLDGTYIFDRSKLRVTVISDNAAQEMVGCSSR